MIIERTVLMNSEDIFQMVKEWISNNVSGVKESEICSYIIVADGSTKPIIRVILEDTKVDYGS